MKDVYVECPVLGNEAFLLQRTVKADAQELLEVYSDEKAVPFFNSDNCNGDNFFYRTLEQMQAEINFWEASYRSRAFVRWSIFDRSSGKAVGTIEMFCRMADDFFNKTGLLRLDLKSEYEKEDVICSILEPLLEQAPELFGCESVSTKAVKEAAERRKALECLGFKETAEKLKGHDGTAYGDYYMLRCE